MSDSASKEEEVEVEEVEEEEEEVVVVMGEEGWRQRTRGSSNESGSALLLSTK